MLPLTLEPTLHNLSQQQTDPLCAYIYDIDALRHHAANLREALPGNCELFYAAKANPEAKILQALAPLVDGFEAASGGELKWLRQQLPEQRLIFGGPGKLDSELAAALDLNVELIHVESPYELQKLQAIAQQQGIEASVLLRMNIAIGDIGQTRLSMGGRPTPFGIEQAQLPQALATLQECPNLKFKGFHFHLMSHQLDRKNHLKLMALYFETFKQWRQTYDLDINHLNVGGGIGINYTDPANTFDWPLFCTELGELIRSQQMQETTIRFECGRFVTAQCGYYSMEVLDIKQSHGETFVVARGGTHHFRTPAAQSHSHPFTICKRQDPIAAAPTIKQTQVTIVGQLCTPKDVLAKQQWVEDLSVGDHIVFTHAGAYAWNISHQHFLMHDKPQMVFLE